MLSPEASGQFLIFSYYNFKLLNHKLLNYFQNDTSTQSFKNI
jgi:hypothetical protein